MNPRQVPSIRRSVAVAILGLLSEACHAQDAPAPSPATSAARPASAARAGIEASDPRVERSAREGTAKMDAVQKAMDARIARVTRSICAGCTAAPPVRRPHLATPASADEPRRRDPAQAPVD